MGLAYGLGCRLDPQTSVEEVCIRVLRGAMVEKRINVPVGIARVGVQVFLDMSGVLVY